MTSSIWLNDFDKFGTSSSLKPLPMDNLTFGPNFNLVSKSSSWTFSIIVLLIGRPLLSSSSCELWAKSLPSMYSTLLTSLGNTSQDEKWTNANLVFSSSNVYLALKSKSPFYVPHISMAIFGDFSNLIKTLFIFWSRSSLSIILWSKAS